LYRDVAEREAKIRRLVDANIIGIFISSRKGEIIEANDAFLRMVGYDREDLAAGNMRWNDLTPPEWRTSTASALKGMDTTGAIQPYESEYVRKDGSRVPVLIGSAGFDEQRDQGVAFVLDLTERKRAEEALRHMQMELAHANRVATMGQLSASIAHEVKQPITATAINAAAALRWLNRAPPDVEEVRQLLAKIANDSKRAGNVVGRIHDLVKKAPPRMERLDVGKAINEVIEVVAGETRGNRVLVQTQLAEGLPAANADPTQFQQVILNLILNAVQAMNESEPTSRKLFIDTTANGSNGLLVSIRDTGPGIPEEHLDRLFDPFYTTKSSGMGMGLAICRSIVEAHGGQIWATANVPRGAAFHFTLRAAAENVEPA
jgi:PAS domain S-box-containing protein